MNNILDRKQSLIVKNIETSPLRKSIRRNSTQKSSINSIPRESLKKSGLMSLKTESNIVNISKKELSDLLKNLKNEVLNEVKIKSNISDSYLNEIIENNDVIEDDKYHLKFSKNKLKNILDKYGQKVEEEKRINEIKKNNEYENFLSRYQNYTNFTNLLWYYYNYNPQMYTELLEEYNYRLHDQLLIKLGLPSLSSQRTNNKTENFNEMKKEFTPEYNLTSEKKRQSNYFNFPDMTQNNKNEEEKFSRKSSILKKKEIILPRHSKMKSSVINLNSISKLNENGLNLKSKVSDLDKNKIHTLKDISSILEKNSSISHIHASLLKENESYIHKKNQLSLNYNENNFNNRKESIPIALKTNRYRNAFKNLPKLDIPKRNF